MTVVIARVQNKLVLTSPYHPALLKPAKDLGGKWNGSNWVFDPRDEERVRALCVQVYGSDGSPQYEADLVSVRLTAQRDVHSEYREQLYVAGRSIVYALHRDSGGKMSPGTVKLSGNVYSRGSARNWYVSVEKDTVLEVRDIPRAVLAGISQDDWAWEIVSEQAKPAAVPVLPGDDLDPYAGMTADDEFRILADILRGMTPTQILNIAGVFESVREELNNEILERWEQETQ